MKLKLSFITDPGHGWLAVPLYHLNALGIKDHISGYSYKSSSGIAYLEEDLDAGTFFKAAKAAGWEIEISEKYSDPCPIRNYPSYPNHPDWAKLSGWKHAA